MAPDEQPGFRPDTHTHLQLAFDDEGPDVYFRDVRKFGKVEWIPPGKDLERLSRLGPDALEFTGDALFAATRKRTVAIKSLLLSQAVVIRPDFTPGLYRLAEGYRTLGMNHDAVVYIEKAIRLAPSIPAYPASLGMIQIELGLLHRAEDSFLKALELDPTLASPHRGMAEIARRGGDYATALEQIDAGLADDRLRKVERSDLEQFRADVAAEEIRLNKLLVAMDEQTATTSDYSLLARIHARRGEWAQAAAMEQLGENSTPGLLGYYLLQAGNFAAAEQFYRNYPDTSGNPMIASIFSASASRFKAQRLPLSDSSRLCTKNARVGASEM